jgi:large subunit ribosomal protein L14
MIEKSLNDYLIKMISEQTIVNIIDNSGAIEGRCIKLLIPKSSYGHRSAGVGDVIILSVTKTIPGSKIKKGDIMKALIVRTKKDSNRLKPIKRGFKYLINTYKDPLTPQSPLRGHSLRQSGVDRPLGSKDLSGGDLTYLEISVPGKTTNKTGYSLSYVDNSVVLVKTQGTGSSSDLTPIGSRVRGPLCDSLKINVRNGCKKLIAIS